MAKRQKPSKAELERLARLPRLDDLMIEGGQRPLGVYVQEGKERIQPRVALWVDARSQFVRGTAIINPAESADGGTGETLEALVQALTNPVVAPFMDDPAAAATGQRPALRIGPPPAGLPARILVDDAELAEAARAIFAPLDVPVEVAAHLPAFEDAYAAIAAHLGGDPTGAPPEPFSWEIEAALVRPLYAAAAAYARATPWTYMPDHPPLAVYVAGDGPLPGLDTLYASILGAGGEVRGVALYYSLDDFRHALHRGGEMNLELDDEDIELAVETLRQAGAPVDKMAPDELDAAIDDFMGMMTGEVGPETFDNALVLFLDKKTEIDPTYLEWLEDRKIPYPRQNVPQFLRTETGAMPRQPNAHEVTALTRALDLLTKFFKEYRQALQQPFLPPQGYAYAEVAEPAGRRRGEVRFPPPGYDWQADEEWLDELDEDETD